MQPGDVVTVVGLLSRSDLNGRSARVVSRDVKRERWNVFVDGEGKKLALREENLQLAANRAGVQKREADDDDFEDTREAQRAEASAPLAHATGAPAKRGAAPSGKAAATAAEDMGPGVAGAAKRKRPKQAAEELTSATAKPAVAEDAPSRRSTPRPAKQPLGKPNPSGPSAGSSPGQGKQGKATASAALAAQPGRASAAQPGRADEAEPGSKAARKRPMSQAQHVEPDQPEDQPEDGGSAGTTRWKRKNRSASDAWEAALDAMQPDSDQEDADADGARGGAASSAGASSGAPRRDPRMRGFRIGGQAETAEERGEGWCGPWSTASRLVEQREEARLAREEAIASGQDVTPLHEWKPRRDSSTSGARPSSSAVPSLQQLCVAFLVENIDAVASFGMLSPGIQHSIAASLCTVRKLDDDALGLLTAADAAVNELIVPDCSQVTEGALLGALGRLSMVGLVDLGYCGRPTTPKVAALLQTFDQLHTLRLRGCFRLSTPSLVALLERRGDNFVELELSANTQLGPDVVRAIADHCGGGRLETLRLEELDTLAPEAMTPLGRLTSLSILSLAGAMLLQDDALVAAIDGSAASLTSLSVRSCSLLGPESIVTAARLCPHLKSLNLEGVEMLTDDAIVALSEGVPALEDVSLKGCVQLSDEAIRALAAGCCGLERVVLNKIPALSDGALLALRTHCSETLTALDVSWCRGVTDHGLGALVDAAAELRTLTLWGCSQVTPFFYDGHSNADLRVIGRGVGG